MNRVVEKFRHSETDIAILRFSVIFIITLYGVFKWFDFEVEALKPIISGSWLSFLYTWFGFHGASYLLGAVETVTYLSLIIGYKKPHIGILGAILTLLIGMVTLSTLPQLGMSGFIVKDILLLGAGAVLLKYDLNRVADNKA